MRDSKPTLMHPDRFSDASPGRLIPIELHRLRPTASGVVEREPVPAWSYVPDTLPPKEDWLAIQGELYGRAQIAAGAIGRVNGCVPSAPHPSALRHGLLLREARLSSAIEDIHTTALDMIIAGSAHRRSNDTDHAGLEAWNSMRAVVHGLDSDLPFCSRLIREMHEKLLTGVRGEDKSPGVFRTMPAYIGPKYKPERARFVPPPPGDGPNGVVSCMSALERFENTSSQLDALIRVALMHYQFETIHPFRDGNGRIGRALVVLQMCRRNLVTLPVISISGFANANKARYVDSLFAVSADGDWLGWFEFFLDAVAYEAAKVERMAQQLIALYKDQKSAVVASNAPTRHLQLLDYLFENPIVSAKAVEDLLGVSNPTARKDILDFEKRGMLRLTEDVSYGKLWYAAPILEIVEDDGESNDTEA